MLQIKVFQILAALNKEEFTSFGKFVNSPYFNRSSDLIRLFDIVKKFYPEFPEEKISSEKIYKKIYPGKKYNEGTMRNLFSDLGSLSEKFLGFIKYENSFEYGFAVVTELQERGLKKFYYKNYEKLYEENSINEHTFYKKCLHEFLLESERLNDRAIVGKKEILDLMNSSSEALLIFLLKEFFLKQTSFRSLERSYNLNNENNIVYAFFRNTDTKKLIQSFKENKNPNADEIELYYFLFLAEENSDDNIAVNFENAYKIFRDLKSRMTKPVLKHCFIWLQNIIKLNLKPDDLQMQRKLFELIKEGLRERWQSEINGKIHHVEFSNFIIAAINVQETEWADDFLESKKDELDENIKDDFYYFYKARILFEFGRYSESLELLSKIRKENLQFKTDIKILRLLNFYELNYIETAFSQTEAFRQYLIRTDIISDNRHELISNFLKFYVMLLKIKSGDEKDVSNCVYEIKNCAKVRNKNWLLKKAEELEKNN